MRKNIRVRKSFGSGESGQFTARANILATVVLPVPRGPVNRYACAILPLLTCALSVFTVISCPITSSKQVGRQARYSALYAISASLSQSGSNRLPQKSRYWAALCILRRPHGLMAGLCRIPLFKTLFIITHSYLFHNLICPIYARYATITRFFCKNAALSRKKEPYLAAEKKEKTTLRWFTAKVLSPPCGACRLGRKHQYLRFLAASAFFFLLTLGFS